MFGAIPPFKSDAVWVDETKAPIRVNATAKGQDTVSGRSDSNCPSETCRNRSAMCFYGVSMFSSNELD